MLIFQVELIITFTSGAAGRMKRVNISNRRLAHISTFLGEDME